MLIYLTVIRPDTTFVVSVLSRFMHEPKEADWSAALKILAYIKGCPGKGLVFRKYGHIHVSECSDSDYVGERDMKFISRYCSFVGENLVT